MVEPTQDRDTLYQQALEFYRQGAWHRVIELVAGVEEKTDEMRSLLAAARWQIALARAQQKVRADTQPAPAAPTPKQRGFSWLVPALVTANFFVAAVLVVAIFAIWQGRSVPAFSAFATPPSEPSPLNRAEAAMASQDWDTAIQLLQALLQDEPDNVAARELLARALQQRRLQSLFMQAEGYYNRRMWEQALEGFQSLRTAAPDFRAAEVTAYLCRTYLQLIRAQLIEAQGKIEKLLPLRARLMEYATECQEDEDFAAERQLLDLYIAGIEALQLQRWSEAIDFFERLRSFDPNYAAGQVTQHLYAAHVYQGNEYVQAGKWLEALDAYEAALSLGVPDVLGAARLRTEAIAAMNTPTPTPVLAMTAKTFTPTVAATPTPTVTPSTTPSPPPTSTATPTVRRRTLPAVRPRPTATPTPWPTPTPRPRHKPAPPQPAPPTATPVPPTSTPPPTPTPLPTATPPPTATPTPAERDRRPTPTPSDIQRPPTPTPTP